ncbi:MULTISPECIES: hypothetical protein [Haloarcula]|uniref:hypothetical protein n=1 Tax=Haloarcula TaxID=2237 RepID=UPI0023EC8F4A|nr:hypothetical protein [Halomicroarcula sp. XH51]
MVEPVPVVVGVGIVVLAASGLLEVTGYTEQQRLDHRRLMQAFTYGSLVVVAFGLAAVWYGLRNASLPTWLFVAINVTVVTVVIAQWRLRRALSNDE